VKVKCFGCDALIAADDVDAAVEAFVAHGRERHNWSYPENALRNYARNYAEATVRLTGGTERLSQIAAVAIHPMTAERLDDWLRFFDHDAFADNPDWASCYCLEPHLPASPEQPERPWRETRVCMAERFASGTTFGYLAYVNGRVAGWVNASLRADYGLYRGVDPNGPEPSSVIGVSCFVIAPPFRRHGVASALLDRVIADAPARGAAWIEAYPRNTPDENDAAYFRGARSMYDARGFKVVEMRDRDTVVRRAARR
jgi:ribosomal protein S18 acetylase RimI-like enzyme